VLQVKQVRSLHADFLADVLAADCYRKTSSATSSCSLVRIGPWFNVDSAWFSLAALAQTAPSASSTFPVLALVCLLNPLCRLLMLPRSERDEQKFLKMVRKFEVGSLSPDQYQSEGALELVSPQL
jgi:hypothetical protein